jgi:hypothetical protein
MMIIPMTTATMSSAAVPSASLVSGGAAIIWQNSSAGDGGKLWVYTTASTGWMASTTNFTSTST